MMSAETGQYIGLNEVGAAIWDLIETPKPTEKIEMALLAERHAIELKPSPRP